MASTNKGDSSGLYTLITGVVLVCLVSVFTVVGLLRLADALEPKVGDIVSFEHLGKLGPIAQEKIPASRVDNRASGTRCALDVRTMRASGGSIVIEALHLWPEPMYRVHWIGFHTSTGEEDCGAVADLALSRIQVVELMSAANSPTVPSEKAYPDLLSGIAVSALH